MATAAPEFTAASPYKTHQPTEAPNSPLVHSFYDKPTSTFTFVVACPKTKEAVIIDPVLDFDAASGKITQTSVQGLVGFAKQQGYSIKHVIETHVHADHLTGAHALTQLIPGLSSAWIGSGVSTAQAHFGPIYGINPKDFADSFGRTLSDGDTFKLGQLKGKVHAVPGHTPESVAIAFGDAIFGGDSVFL